MGYGFAPIPPFDKDHKGGQGSFTGKARHAQRGFLDMH